MRLQLRIRASNGALYTLVSNASGFVTSSAKRGATTSVGVATNPIGEAENQIFLSPTWSCALGANRYDHIYNGNTWNGSAYTEGWDMPGYIPSPPSQVTWSPALLYADPGGASPTTMSAQAFPPVVVQREYPAISLSSPSQGVYVVDFGENGAGIVRLTLPSPVPAGLVITLRHAEILQHPPYGPADGNIYVGNLRSAAATDVYITKGGGEGEESEVYEPVFTYHGFRYVEVTGLDGYIIPTLDMFTALRMRTGVTITGNLAFPSTAVTAAMGLESRGSGNILNTLQSAIQTSIASNIMSVISDCDNRDERKGWLGDSALSLVPTLYNFRIAPFYTAWARNMQDSMLWQGDEHPAGTLPDTVPHTFAEYPSDPAWGNAYPGVVWTVLVGEGDVRIVSEHWDTLVAYIAFLMAQVGESSDGISTLCESLLCVRVLLLASSVVFIPRPFLTPLFFGGCFIIPPPPPTHP